MREAPFSRRLQFGKDATATWLSHQFGHTVNIVVQTFPVFGRKENGVRSTPWFSHQMFSMRQLRTMPLYSG